MLKWFLPRRRNSRTKGFFSHLSEGDTEFMIGTSNHEVHIENRDCMTYRGTYSDSTNNLTQIIYPQVICTLEENLGSKVRSEVDIVMTTVETRVQDAALTAIENLTISRVQLAMKSANASSGRSVDGNVLIPDQRGFWSNVESSQMTISSRIHSRTDLNRIDESQSLVLFGKIARKKLDL